MAVREVAKLRAIHVEQRPQLPARGRGARARAWPRDRRRPRRAAAGSAPSRAGRRDDAPSAGARPARARPRAPHSAPHGRRPRGSRRAAPARRSEITSSGMPAAAQDSRQACAQAAGSRLQAVVDVHGPQPERLRARRVPPSRAAGRWSRGRRTARRRHRLPASPDRWRRAAAARRSAANGMGLRLRRRPRIRAAACGVRRGAPRPAAP